MSSSLVDWLLASDEPWTRYRTLVDLRDCGEEEAEARAARAAMLRDDRVRGLIATAAGRGERPITRHNDAGHPLHALSTLADFGLRAGDPGLKAVLRDALSHQSPEGAFQSLVNISPAYGGSGEDAWSWVLCDAPTVLHAVLAMGLGGDRRVQQALDHLASLARDNGWPCAAAPELGKFRGPGRKSDPCPIANLAALKALAHLPALADSPAARAGVEMLLGHWERRGDAKMYLFGIGTDFRKLKYPFVWYDILHVTDVLSRFESARRDPRFRDMLQAMAAQADAEGRFTAGSMYQAWKGWSFADKKRPSPWLTFLALRVMTRAGLDSRSPHSEPRHSG